MPGKECGFALLKLAADALALLFAVLFMGSLVFEPWWTPALLPWTYLELIIAGSVILIFAVTWLQVRYAKALTARFPIVEKKWFSRAVIVIIVSLPPLGRLLRDIFRWLVA